MKDTATEVARALEGARGTIPAVAVAGIIAGWKAKHHSPHTIFRRTQALRKILRSIDYELRTTLSAHVPKIRQPDARRTTINPDELARMLALATPGMRLLLLLMSTMALRISEAEKAAPEHFNDEKQTLTLTTKGGHRREFPVPDDIAALLRAAPIAPEGWSFIDALRGKKVSHHQWRKNWRKLKKLAGVRAEVNPHDLRRTAAIRVYTLTKDVLAAKELLGHDNLNSTAYYLQPYDVNAMKQIRHALTAWTPKEGEPKQ